MTNSIRIPKQGMTVNSKRIAQAVDDEDWQEFRVSMKGKTTREKLDMLCAYYDSMMDDSDLADEEILHVVIRVDNYIKALCRGGQLYGGESLQSLLNCNWLPKIKS